MRNSLKSVSLRMGLRISILTTSSPQQFSFPRKLQNPCPWHTYQNRNFFCSLLLLHFYILFHRFLYFLWAGVGGCGMMLQNRSAKLKPNDLVILFSSYCFFHVLYRCSFYFYTSLVIYVYNFVFCIQLTLYHLYYFILLHFFLMPSLPHPLLLCPSDHLKCLDGHVPGSTLVLTQIYSYVH